MSGSCKSALFLLQRCVAVLRLSGAAAAAATQTRSGVLSACSWSHVQRRAWASGGASVGLRTLGQLQPALTGTRHRFCTKAESPCEAEYPPLPNYEVDQPETKEVYIVQVKGLPWSCTAQDLLQFFSVYEVTNADAEVILKRETRGEDGVVLLRGLPFSSSEDDVVRFFSDLKIAEDGITIVTNSRGRNSGEAYVQFSSQAEADRALQKHRELMGHRYIEVFPSSRADVQSARKRLASWNPSQPASRRPVPEYQSNQRAVSQQVSDVPTHYIHMRGLPFQVTGEDIAKFFSPLAVAKIRVEFGPDGRPSGEADVFFRRHQDAVDAMSRDRMSMGHRYIELFLNSVPESDSL
uniref:G-rich RNA sequence binding factor 1 n=1 Tax=Fundulus heteroclitus TaxID=8078 RepID=A0A3Q2QNQ6_FUNHE